MTTVFPGAIDAIPRPLPTTLRNAAGLSLSSRIDDLADAVEAAQTKLGSGGAGTAAPPATAAVLRRTATGQSGWGPVVVGDMAGPGAGSANTVLRTTDGTTLALGKIVTADITAGNVTQLFYNQDSSAASTSSGTFTGTGQQLNLTGLTIGSPVQVILSGSLVQTSGTIGQSMQLGIGIDSATVQTYGQAHSQALNISANVTSQYRFTATATSHTVYALWSVTGGVIMARAPWHTMFAIESKR